MMEPRAEPMLPLGRQNAERWMNLAAVVTWTGLAIFAVHRSLTVTFLNANEKRLGLALVSLTLLLGGIHIFTSLGRSRRAWLSIYLQTIAALGSVLAMKAGTLSVFLIIIVTQTTFVGPRHRGLAWMGAANSIDLALRMTFLPLTAALISFALSLGFQLFAFAMSSAVAAERNLSLSLAGVNAELVATRRLLQESARSEERLRISRDLHDVAGHHLTALKLNLQSAKTRSDLAPERIQLCLDLSSELLTGIRSVVHRLRDHDAIDVHSALRALQNQHPDLQVELDIDADLTVRTVEVAEALVRTTQEAIANAVTHGRARQLSIRLAPSPEGLCLSIEDDGQGGPRNAGGRGLEGLSERAERLEGSLRITSRSSQGWTVALFLPAEGVS
ncbi:MAG: histidine kinase [Myxococcota bacterium]